MDTSGFFIAGAGVSAHVAFFLENPAVGGIGAFCCGDWIIGGATCGLRVEVESESIRGVGHLILHSSGDSLLRGVDGFDVEIFARLGDLEGAGI